MRLSVHLSVQQVRQKIFRGKEIEIDEVRNKNMTRHAVIGQSSAMQKQLML